MHPINFTAQFWKFQEYWLQYILMIFCYSQRTSESTLTARTDTGQVKKGCPKTYFKENANWKT